MLLMRASASKPTARPGPCRQRPEAQRSRRRDPARNFSPLKKRTGARGIAGLEGARPAPGTTSQHQQNPCRFNPLKPVRHYPGPRLPAASALQNQSLKPSRADNGTIANPLGTIKNDVQTTTWLKPCAEPFILYSTHKPGPQPRTPFRRANTLPPPRKSRAQNSPPKRSRDAAATTFERRCRCR